MAQATMNYLFNPKTYGDIGKSFKDVNWWQVGRSAAEGLIPWRTPGGRIGRAAASAIDGKTEIIDRNVVNTVDTFTMSKSVIKFGTYFYYTADGYIKRRSLDGQEVKSLTKANAGFLCQE